MAISLSAPDRGNDIARQWFRRMNNVQRSCATALASIDTQRLDLAGAVSTCSNTLEWAGSLTVTDTELGVAVTAHFSAAAWNLADWVALRDTELPALITVAHNRQDAIIVGTFGPNDNLRLNGVMAPPAKTACVDALNAILARFV